MSRFSFFATASHGVLLLAGALTALVPSANASRVVATHPAVATARRVAVLMAVVASVVASPASAQIAGSFPVAGELSGMEAEGDGLRLAVVDRTGMAAVDHVDAAGLTTRRDLLADSPYTGSAENAVLTPGGGLALFTREPSGGGDSLVLDVSTRSGDLLSRQQVSPSGRQAIPQTPLVVGPTGAAAVGWYEERAGRRTVLRMAFRPAGARRFRKPVDVGGLVRGIDAMAIALGPDGGGVVIALPDVTDEGQRPTTLRRISPSGRVGRGIVAPVGVRGGHWWTTTVRTAFRADGTLLAAFYSLGYDDEGRSSSWFAALGPGARSRLRVQNLVDDRPGGFEYPVIAAGGSGRVVAMVPGVDGRTRLYDGTARGLRPVRGFAPARADSVRLGTTSSGRTLIAWSGALSGHRTGLIASAQTASGGFTLPALLPGSPPTTEFIDGVTNIVGLTDGRIATSWYTPEDRGGGGDDYILIAPAPR